MLCCLNFMLLHNSMGIKKVKLVILSLRHCGLINNLLLMCRSTGQCYSVKHLLHNYIGIKKRSQTCNIIRTPLRTNK